MSLDSISLGDLFGSTARKFQRRVLVARIGLLSRCVERLEAEEGENEVAYEDNVAGGPGAAHCGRDGVCNWEIGQLGSETLKSNVRLQSFLIRAVCVPCLIRMQLRRPSSASAKARAC